MLRKFRGFALVTLTAASVVFFVGCNGSRTDTPEAGDSGQPRETKTTEGATDGEHAHRPGSHGGIIVEIGRDNYHAEAVFEKGGTLRLYTLGKDDAKVQEVESQILTAYAKTAVGTESSSFTLRPMPQSGDAEAHTSQFVGELPKELRGKPLEVTIPSFRIAGERFRLGFASVSESHEDAMLPKVADEEEERALYLTPRGKYTEADVKANGNMTASQKFKGLKAAHEAKPAPGDKICPISLTKASSKFTWIVGGKPYEFCCPPCVDEFVKAAKETPEQVKEPGDYVKAK